MDTRLWWLSTTLATTNNQEVVTMGISGDQQAATCAECGCELDFANTDALCQSCLQAMVDEELGDS